MRYPRDVLFSNSFIVMFSTTPHCWPFLCKSKLAAYAVSSFPPITVKLRSFSIAVSICFTVLLSKNVYGSFTLAPFLYYYGLFVDLLLLSSVILSMMLAFFHSGGRSLMIWHCPQLDGQNIWLLCVGYIVCWVFLVVGSLYDDFIK